MIRQKRIATMIVALYAITLPLFGYLAYRFLNNTNTVYIAPDNSIVAKSEVLAHKYFSDQVGYTPMWILVQSTNASESIVENEAFHRYCLYFNASVHAGGDLFGDVGYVEGYYFVPNVTQFQDQLVGGANNDSTLLSINVISPRYIKFADTLQAFNDAWLSANNVTSFTFQYTGVAMIEEDLENGIISDLAVIDSISLPLAFAALVYCLRSLRLVLIPVFTLPCTVVIAFSIMLPVSYATDVTSVAPEMAVATMMAITIDYALFILSRFVEQVEMQHAKFGPSEEVEWLVIKNTAILSAHNILISGLTIAVALGGLAFLPISFLSTIGMTMSCGAVCAVFVSLTLMPSLLFTFFGFFSMSNDFEILANKWRRWRERRAAERQLAAQNDDGNHAVDAAASKTPLLGQEEEEEGFAGGERQASGGSIMSSARKRPTKSSSDLLASPGDVAEYQVQQYRLQSTSVWFKVGNFAFRRPFVTTLFIAAIGVPFFYYAFLLRVDFDLFNQVPRDSVHANVLKTITTEIGRGTAAPFYLTFTSLNESDTVWSDPRYFSLINNVTRALSQKTGQPLERILSPCMLPPSAETGNETAWLTNLDSMALWALSSDYRFLFQRTVSSKQTAALLSVYTTFDPFAWQANDYLNNVHDIITAFQAGNEDWIFIGMLGASADSWAIMDDAMSLFPYQIVITFSVIFFFIALVFRSVFVPFRMVFTVAYTIGVSYGAGVIMFQYKWLHTVWPALDGVNAYSWTVPIFSFSLLSALALDYDVFLLTRIVEFKHMGYCDEAAISKAVWKTGRIISFAGVIMAISFGSLVFSNTVMLNQFGAIAAFAVAVDTFIIRPLFVPALMSLFPRQAWWPRKFPELERTVDDMRGELAEDLNSPRSSVIAIPHRSYSSLS